MHIGYKLSQITIRTNNFNPHRPPKPNSDEVFFTRRIKGPAGIVIFTTVGVIYHKWNAINPYSRGKTLVGIWVLA